MKKQRCIQASARKFGSIFIDANFAEVIVPSIWEEETFLTKTGPQLGQQMYSFKDKGDRNICLIPEITGLLQEEWNKSWSNIVKKPYRIFYIQRCYRYDRPQKGRYREFTQAGIEIFGGRNQEELDLEAQNILKGCLEQFNIEYNFNPIVSRGLNYYIKSGFEAEIESLGAQKQIAGGGRYEEGVGWAIGVDRILVALLEKQQKENK
jgi:histidyl-tRNA synthetase